MLKSIVISLCIILMTINVSFSVNNENWILDENFIKNFSVEDYNNSHKEHLTNQFKSLKINISKYLLSGSFKTDEEKLKIFEQAKKYSQVTLTKIFSDLKNNQSPKFHVMQIPQWSLKEEIKYLNRLSLKAKNKISKIQMTILNKLFNNFDLSLLQASTLINDENDKEIFTFLEELQKEETEDGKIFDIFSRFEKEAQKFIDTVENVGDELSKSSDIKLSDKMAEDLIKGFLNYYYSNISLDKMKNILSDIMALGRKPTQKEIIQIMFVNSGPGVGKLFQQLARNPGVGESFASLLSLLESKGKKVPYYLIKEKFMSNQAYDFLEISEKPLGTGTVAQVQRAVILWQKEELEVAVRTLKPGIKESAEEDIKILWNFFNSSKIDFPEFEKAMKAVGKYLELDLDIKGTIKKQKKFRKFYNKVQKIEIDDKIISFETYVPKVYINKKLDSDLHVQELINFGDNYNELDDIFKQKVVSSGMLGLWLGEAIFESGNFHGDLHLGNFTIDFNSKAKSAKVTIFDYGMTNSLRHLIQRAFMMIGTGAKLNNTEIIAKGFHILSGSKSKKKYKAISKLLAENKTKEIKQVSQWMSLAAKNGHFLSDELWTFIRGSLLLKQLPMTIGMEDMVDDTIMKLYLERWKRHLPFSKKEMPLKITDFFYMGTKIVKSKCKQLINYFF